jgi:hypothetical protein
MAAATSNDADATAHASASENGAIRGRCGRH